MIYSHFKGHLQKASKVYWFFFFLAVSSPFIALYVPVRPENIDLANWFSRSGAAMVVFALFAEAKAVQVSKMLNASGMRTKGYERFIDDHIFYSVQLNRWAFLLIGTGTFIWGFGDLFV